jgi:pyruvate dehydrogenase E2 component (dihydrolipoamide acetyltransferase)
MMPSALVMPKPGQFTEECTIVRWLKKEGDPVAKGDVVFEIETDKSNMEVESFFDGVLLKILVPEGVPVPVQTVVGYVGQPGEVVPDTAPPPPSKPEREPTAAPAPMPTPKAAEMAHAPAAVSGAAPPSAPAVSPAAAVAPPVSPRARRLAREKAIDPSKIRGRGPGGRVVETDVRAYLAERGYDRIRVTPAALELARKEGIDILEVAGTGIGGRITVEDVRRAAEERPRPMSRMRQTIAQRLTHSFTTTPHIFVTVSADMTDLMDVRREAKQRGAPYTITDAIAYAVVRALTEFPAFNSVTDGRTVSRRSSVHLGLAVALDDGLVVPVIRRAQELSLAELHEAAATLVAKARAGKLTPEERSGGTFTISNMGMLDVESFTAIINPGESGILAVSSAMPRPWVRDGRIVVRQVMKMTVSADHRLIDGATAAGFLNSIRKRLEDRKSWTSLMS